MGADGHRPFYERDDFGGRGRKAARPPDADELKDFDLNDFGNAMRLIRMVGGEIDDYGGVGLDCAEVLYLRDAGWIGFNGRYWDQAHGERLAQRLAHRVARGLWEQAELVPEKKRKDFFDFAEQSGNAGRTAAMLKQAMAYLQVDLDDFDPDPLALCVRNGTLRFRRGEDGRRPTVEFDPKHWPADRITRMAEVDYRPDAAAPLWAAKLEEWLPETYKRDYVRRMAGYCATGRTEEQKFFVFQGLGRDGKSTFVGAIRDTLGKGQYAATADVRSFLDTGARSAADASPDMARLAGDTRIVCVSEPPRNARLNDAMIKSFTGGAPVLARRLRMDPFEFTPRPKVIMEVNNRPNPSGDDDGIWRRISLVLWQNQLPPDKVDKLLPDKLNAERPGILNWIVEGVLEWLEVGLAEPPEVASALDDYRRGASPFGEWLMDRVELVPGHKILASELYADFKDWAEKQGHEKIMSQQAFGRALGDRQVLLAGKDGQGRKQRSGAKLRPAWDTGAPDEGASAGGQALGTAPAGEGDYDPSIT